MLSIIILILIYVNKKQTASERIQLSGYWIAAFCILLIFELSLLGVIIDKTYSVLLHYIFYLSFFFLLSAHEKSFIKQIILLKSFLILSIWLAYPVLKLYPGLVLLLQNEQWPSKLLLFEALAYDNCINSTDCNRCIS